MFKICIFATTLKIEVIKWLFNKITEHFQWKEFFVNEVNLWCCKSTFVVFLKYENKFSVEK